MSKPPSGIYAIYNRVLSPAGEKLALNFNGQSQTVTVKPLDRSDAQIWNIVDYHDGKTQSLTPKSSSSLQAAWGDNVVSVQPAGGYVWMIRSIDSGYTIQDGGLTVFWGITSANVNGNASIGPDQAFPTQRWIFERQ
ncbi:hypothetical protein BJ912DRAFT_952872 [Pholiota molesta]|nr:hypothetical protein BJ912DRAFT_952872 [Pholiota molesta]